MNRARCARIELFRCNQYFLPNRKIKITPRPVIIFEIHAVSFVAHLCVKAAGTARFHASGIKAVNRRER